MSAKFREKLYTANKKIYFSKTLFYNKYIIFSNLLIFFPYLSINLWNMIPTLSITKFRYLWRMIFRDNERCLTFFSFWDHDLG